MDSSSLRKRRRWHMRKQPANDDANEREADRPPGWRRRRLGLRAKFNAILVPLIAAALATIVCLDYRHEFSAVMDAHGVHAIRVTDVSTLTPVSEPTTPAAVVRRTLVLHAEAGLATLIVLVIAVNLTLSRLVLAPLARVRSGIERMRDGLRITDLKTVGSDEVAGVVEAFGQLGLSLDAVMFHAMKTDRLATLALLSTHIATQIEPEIRGV